MERRTVKGSKGNVRPIEYLTADEATTFLNTPYPGSIRDRSMIGLALKCGLRSSEVVALLRRDLFPTENKLMVRYGKGGKTRYVPVPPELMEMLGNFSASLSMDDRLFPMYRQAFHAMVQRYGKRAGLERDIYPHLLRHTYAIHRLKAGMDIRSLQKVLGHSNIATTEVYLQVTAADVMKAAEDHPLPY